jgi:hypothetical protein
MSFNRRSSLGVALVASLVAAVLLAFPTPLMAREIDRSHPCGVSVSYVVDGAPVAGVAARLYRVADVSENGGLLTATADFEGAGVSLDMTQASSSWSAGARSLAAYASAAGVRPVAEGRSDAGGIASFDGLSCGLYLVVTDEVVVDGSTYAFQPMLVGLPRDDGAAWSYRTDLVAKAEKRPEPTGGNVSHKVVKRWADDGAAVRPEAIRVAILKDGVKQEERTLDSSNDWSYSWEAPDDGSTWSVAELGVPSGYGVGYDGDGSTFMVTNTLKEPPARKRVPASRLPKSGDATSWAVVGLLALCGVASLTASAATRSRRHHG